ncbi:MAG TPA: response regulator, partial [Longimicrobium sp.]|nr:response regulator [Longimicrobium sp.]
HTLRNILRSAGCAVWEASDGATALDLLRAHAFDVAFLDLMLPDLPGLDILRQAKEVGRAPGRVIVLTGLPDAKSRAEASELGVFAYLTKTPIDVEEIRRVFADAVANPSHAAVAAPPAPPPARAVRVTTAAPHQAGKARPARPSLPRVLVLDDDTGWLDTIRRELGADFDLTVTISPAEACRRVAREPFELVVLDLNLADGDSGLDVLTRMRRTRPGLRAIILTGSTADGGVADEARRRGALDFVTKGSFAALADTITSILNQRSAPPPRIFISYAREDKELVDKLYRKLLVAGLLPWLDSKNIVGGKKWEPEIRKAIDECDFFIFCNSIHSLDRDGMILKELRQAIERESGMRDDAIFVIPVRLDEAPLIKALNAYQCVDLFRRDGFAKLLQAVAPDGNPRE